MGVGSFVAWQAKAEVQEVLHVNAVDSRGCIAAVCCTDSDAEIMHVLERN